MERNLPSYASALACNNLEVLEDIVSNRYVEFIDCYWTLRDYTEYIENLTLKEKHSGLKIKVDMPTLSIKDVIKNIKNNIPKHAKSVIDINDDNNTIVISLKRKTEDE